MGILRRLARSRWLIAIVAALLGAIIGLIPFFFMQCQRCTERRQKEAIVELIQNEAECVLENKVNDAVSQFAHDAVIIDAGKNERWNGEYNIRIRYLTLQKFVDLKHLNIEIRLGPAEGCATAVTDTIGSYVQDGEVVSISSNRGERWTFVKVNGEWKIDSFTYGLPSSE